MRVLIRNLVGLLVTAIALAACTGPGATERQAPGSGPSLPPRPQDIAIDRLDPCSVFTPEQLSRLDVGGEQLTPADKSGYALCLWSHATEEPYETYAVAVITDAGPAERFGQPQKDVSWTTIEGFPAIVTDQVAVGLPRPEHCSALISIAEGQTLQVGYDYNGSALTMTAEQSCGKARTAAGMAMQTLIDRAGGGR